MRYFVCFIPDIVPNREVTNDETTISSPSHSNNYLSLHADLKHDYTLSEEFRKNHFLVGLLLQEVKQALNEVRDVRKVAVATLRNQLAKHAFDDRYQGKVGVCCDMS